ncbi:TonB-dependent receptor plug domain-containing protein [Nibricoccus sp. IMCC34717]|uniref:TonB-dependent receptor plug domain-containing protein n=1 Tax=Nibricoccus sp. IMCC34717 TaxID=3034021 RepID=UPI00384B0260
MAFNLGMSCRLGSVGVFMGLLAAVPAQAQTRSASAEDLAAISLEQLAQVPVEFVTGASKYEQSIRRAPASVTVLTAEDIANFNWRTLGAALNSTPGFHIRSDRFYDYVGNRGFTRPYDYNARTLILVNGHRINDPIYQQGPIGTEFLLDPEMISRIEIIRGPGSSVYGSSAFYGAVNVIPKRASEFAGGQVSTTIDDVLGIKGRATLGNRTASGVEFVASVSAYESPGEKDFTLPQGWRDITGLADERAHDRDGVSLKTGYVNVRWRGLEWESAYGRRVKQVLPVVYYTDLEHSSWGADERAYSLIRYTIDPSPDTSVTAKAAWDHYRYDGSFAPAFAGFDVMRPYSRACSLNAELRVRHQFHGHILLAGVEYQNNFTQDLGRFNETLNQPAVAVSVTSKFMSPFVQVDWTLAPGLYASTGARYDDYSTGEHRTTPRFGLIWEPSHAVTAKLIYGESFRVPNVEERYAQELGLVRNPKIRAETNESLEAVLSYRPSEVWTLEGNFFSTHSHSLIQNVALPNDPTLYTYANVQRIDTDGAELSATAFLKSDIQIRLSSTIQHAHDDAQRGVEIYDAPRHLNKLAITGPLGSRNLRGSLEVLAVSRRHDTGGNRVASAVVVNASLRLLRVWRRADVSLTAYNLFNQRWSDPKNDGQVLSPPRMFALRTTLDF